MLKKKKTPEEIFNTNETNVELNKEYTPLNLLQENKIPYSLDFRISTLKSDF